MKMISVSGRCLRCNDSWDKRNAMALAALHHQRTGHIVEVTTVHREGHQPAAKQAEVGLPFGGKK